MRFANLVVNASPLIVLTKSGLLSVVSRLSDSWIVPETVFNEATAKSDVNPGAINSLPGISIVSSVLIPQVLGWDLGDGESAVLSYSLLHGCLPVCMDDRAAFRCANTSGIPVTGSIGLLIRAKRLGLLPSMREGIDRLQSAGLWLSPSFISDILKREKEN